MGARTSRVEYNQWDLDRLAETSGISRSEIDQLHSDYIKSAGRDGTMDMKEFTRLYSRLPFVKSQGTDHMKEQAARIFRTFDRDHTKTLSFDEFLNAIVMMNHDVPRHDRIDFLVRQNNSNGHQKDDERISSEYGHQIFRRLNDYFGLPGGTEHRCWKQVDPQNRGYVTQEEFLDFISRYPEYNRH